MHANAHVLMFMRKESLGLKRLKTRIKFVRLDLVWAYLIMDHICGISKVYIFLT
jgi:hypothetical protein